MFIRLYNLLKLSSGFSKFLFVENEFLLINMVTMTLLIIKWVVLIHYFIC